MTSQDQATIYLLRWQEQRRAGIPPEKRVLDDKFEADPAVHVASDEESWPRKQ